MGRKFNRTKTNLPKPKPANMPKPKPTNVPQQNTGLLGSMAHGASMGAGMAVGSQIVHGLFSGNNNSNTNGEDNIITEQPKSNNGWDNKCSFEAKQFQECLNNNKNDLGNCQVFYNYLEQCNSHVKRNT